MRTSNPRRRRNMRNSIRRAYPFLLTLQVFLNCAGPRMVPPDGLAGDSQVLDVQNRKRASGMLVNESFQLGAYQVTDVNRKSVGTTTLAIGSFSASGTSTGYSYQVSGGEGTWKGVCAFKRETKGLKLGLGNFSKADFQLVCKCKTGVRGALLELKNQGDQLQGTLAAGGDTYQVKPVTKTDKKTFAAGPAGYQMDAQDGRRGAVETLY